MALVKAIQRFDIYWVDLDLTKGSEIQKTRPCIVVSPNEMNNVLRTVIVIPLTSTVIGWPFRVSISLFSKESSVACDQLRIVSKERLQKKIGSLNETEANAVTEILHTMFAK